MHFYKTLSLSRKFKSSLLKLVSCSIHFATLSILLSWNLCPITCTLMGRLADDNFTGTDTAGTPEVRIYQIHLQIMKALNVYLIDSSE